MKIYSKSYKKSIEVEPGDVCFTTEGYFEFYGQIGYDQYCVWELDPEDDNGRRLEHFIWTAQEVYDAFSRGAI